MVAQFEQGENGTTGKEPTSNFGEANMNRTAAFLGSNFPYPIFKN
jgi:hypothetical protein